MPNNNPTGGRIWTAARDALLREYQEKGYSASTIARHMGGGLTRNAIIGRAHRLKLKFQRGEPEMLRSSNKKRVSDDKKELIAHLAAQGKCRKEISLETGVSEPTVSGIAYRYGIQIQDGRVAGYSQRSLLFKKNPPHKEVINFPDNKTSHGLIGSALFGGKGISLLYRQNNQCAWPLDHRDVDNVPRCCGEPIHNETGQYCIDHFRIAFTSSVGRLASKEI